MQLTEIINEATAKSEGKLNEADQLAIFSRALVGKQIFAFGPGGKGIYGSADKKVSFKITKVEWSYFDAGEDEEDDAFANLNVYLEDYNGKGRDEDFNVIKGPAGIIYTDKTFIAELNKLLKVAKVSYESAGYSEYGMQGPGFVNLDISF